MGKKERRKNCAPSITEGEIGKKKAEIVRAGGGKAAHRPPKLQVHQRDHDHEARGERNGGGEQKRVKGLQ